MERDLVLREGFDNGVRAAAEKVEALAFLPRNLERKHELLELARLIRDLP